MNGWVLIGWALAAGTSIVILGIAVSIAMLFLHTTRDKKFTTQPKEPVEILKSH